MGQLYLIRHGKTALNGSASTDRIRGWADVPLDASGRAQKKMLAQMFESKGLDDIYSSDLARASDTADAIASRAGLTNCSELAFRPWNLGEFQGQESADVAPAISGYVLDRPDEQVPGGESFTDFKTRFLPAFEKLLEEAKTGKTVALVTHYRCVKLAEAWLANGQKDQLAIVPQEFLKADLKPADVLCVYWDAPKQKWQVEPEDGPTAAEGGEVEKPRHILCEIGALDDDESRQRIQVFPEPGEYVHPQAGPFTLSRDDLDEFAADINSRDSIPVDRDHAFYKGMSAPAAGWFVKGSAEATDSGVTAEVEWTPEAAQQVRDREYRFISPEFSFQKRTQKGQKIPEQTLFASTLTNRPFFDEMLPVAAENIALADELVVAEAFGEEVADSLNGMAAGAVTGLVAAAMTKVGSKKGQAANTAGSSFADPGYQKDGQKRYPLDTKEEVQAASRYIGQKRNAARYTPAQVARIKARVQRAAKKFGVTIGADATTGGNEMELTAEVAEALGIAADASEDDVLAAATRVASENADLKAKQDETNDQLKTLIADAAAGAKAATDLAAMKRDAGIKSAVSEGRIVPAESDFYTTLWDKDPEGVEKLLAEKPVMSGFEPIGKTDARVYDAEGKPVKVGDDGDPITADLEPQLSGGIETPIDEDSAKIHAAAENLLRSQGKPSYTDDEYVAACEAVLPTLGLSR